MLSARFWREGERASAMRKRGREHRHESVTGRAGGRPGDKRPWAAGGCVTDGQSRTRVLIPYFGGRSGGDGGGAAAAPVATENGRRRAALNDCRVPLRPPPRAAAAVAGGDGRVSQDSNTLKIPAAL